MKKSFLALPACVLCAALLLCGCQSVVTAGSVSGSATESAAAASSGAAGAPLTIACTSAGFNPYVSDDAITRQDATLLFEPLVAITPDLDLDYRMAQNVDNSGLLVTVQMRSGCFFADGSNVTAEDAAASLNAARLSSQYAARFSNVTDVVVEGSAVCITLTQPDSLFAYLLDIPVLRADEVSLSRPTANGRYTYSDGGDALVLNSRAAFPDGGPAEIGLETVAGADALVSGLAVGSVDLYVLGDDSTETTSINAVETYYRNNDLIYLSVNAGATNPLCSTATGRRLLSTLVDRNDLASKAYYSRAYAATGAINNYYPCVKGRQTILPSADASPLESTMAALGYTRADDGTFQDEKQQPAAVSLLVYSGSSYKRYAAQLLQEQLQANGIRVDITEAASFDDYLAAVQSGQFELYIGEVKLYNNFDLSPFWSGQASYGLAPSEALLAAYSSFRQNSGTAGDFEAAFASEMPFIPLLWHSGTVVTSRRVGGVNASLSSAFYSLADLTVG
ncbi:MAG: ABC transporter substrate-binding protein [Faecalibacterium sp.]|jgi:ABC-type transport system substrate-binding protein|nr:ABC transporter substrate-binding protein [Faecalibacterium sp.]